MLTRSTWTLSKNSMPVTLSRVSNQTGRWFKLLNLAILLTCLPQDKDSVSVRWMILAFLFWEDLVANIPMIVSSLTFAPKTFPKQANNYPKTFSHSPCPLSVTSKLRLLILSIGLLSNASSSPMAYGNARQLSNLRISMKLTEEKAIELQIWKHQLHKIQMAK